MAITEKLKPGFSVALVMMVLSVILWWVGRQNDNEGSLGNAMGEGRLRQFPADVKTGGEHPAISSPPVLIFEGSQGSHLGGEWRIFEPLTDTKYRNLTAKQCNSPCCSATKEPAPAPAKPGLLEEIVTAAKLDNKSEFALLYSEFSRLPGDERLLVSATWPSRSLPRVQLYKIGLPGKTIEPVADGRKFTLLEQDGSRMFVLEHLVKEPFDLTTTLVSGLESVKDRFRIHRVEAQSGLEPQVFDPTPIQSVLFSDEESFWILRNNHLWQLSKDGRSNRQICEVGLIRRAVFSPDKNLIALDVPQAKSPDDSSRENRTVLRVIDRSGKSVFSSQKIDIEVSGFSSFMPALQFAWMDNNKIRFSETVITKRDSMLNEGYFQWTDIDIKSGARTAHKAYSNTLGLMHECPVPPGKQRETKRTKIGLFDVEHATSQPYISTVLSNQVKYGKSLRLAYLSPSTAGVEDWQAKIYYAGSSESINILETLPKARTPWTQVAVQISPDGRWAVLRFANGENQTRLYLVDGEKRKTMLLSDQYGGYESWLQ